MIKKITVILITLALTASLSSCGADKSASEVKVKKASGVETKSKKAKKKEAEQKQALRDAILPALDIATQIRDSAQSVLEGKTESKTAISILSGTANFLTKSKTELSEIKTGDSGNAIVKDKAIAAVDECINEVDNLIDAVKSENKTLINESINSLDVQIKELTALAGMNK